MLICVAEHDPTLDMEASGHEDRNPLVYVILVMRTETHLYTETLVI